MDEKVRYDVRAGIATITLDDPASRNALGSDMLRQLYTALLRARDEDDVRCVVLASAHETVFSAGADLAAFRSNESLLDKYRGMDQFPRVFTLIGELGKPTVCAARGHVLAGSLGLALACDLVVTIETATFGTPEMNVGVFPFMVMALIYRNVGRKQANELLLLGERLSAQEAMRAGLVNRVVPADEFEATVQDLATRLAAKSPALMRLGKDAMWRQMDMPIIEAFEYLRLTLSLALSTEDIDEGVSAFFEKREPRWQGR